MLPGVGTASGAEGTAEPNGNLLHDGVEGAADLGNVLFHFGVEQRLGGDAQCQRHAVRVHVTQVAGLPVLEHTRGVADHGVAVRGEPLGVKGWCSESALTMPKLAFAREQAAAEDRVDVAKEEGKLDGVVCVPDQHVFGVVGAVHSTAGQAPGARPRYPRTVATIRCSSEGRRV